MERHRQQFGDDRTKADAPRASKNLRERDPVKAAQVRQFLYHQSLHGGRSGGDKQSDIEFAALSGNRGPTVGGGTHV